MRRVEAYRDRLAARRERLAEAKAAEAKLRADANRERCLAQFSDAILSTGWETQEKWWSWAAPCGLVVGESHHFDEILSALGGDCPEGEWIACPVDVCYQREPSNRSDPSAIRALVNDQHMGYLPAEVAGKWAAVLDGAGLAWFTVAGVFLGSVDRRERIPPGVFVWPRKLLTTGPVLPAKNEFQGSWGPGVRRGAVGYDPRRGGLWSAEGGLILNDDPTGAG